MTITRHNEMHDINSVLQNSTNSTLIKIIEKAKLLGKINKIFCAQIDSELAKHCYVVDVSVSTVNILVDNATWSTILHYSIPEIIKSLNSQPEFAKITKIKYQIKKR